MKKKGFAAGGMKKKGFAAGGMKKKGFAAGGMKKKGFAEGGLKRSLRPKLRPDDLPPMENASNRPGDVATRGPQAMMSPKMQAKANAKAAMLKKQKQVQARQKSMVEAQEGMPSPADQNSEAKSMLQGMTGGMKKGGGVKKMKSGGIAKKGFKVGGITKKGKAKGGKTKVRGAGIAQRGVRAAKMR